MPSQEYTDRWQEANQWMHENAPDWVMRISMEWYDVAMAALPRVMLLTQLLEGVSYNGDDPSGAVARLRRALQLVWDFEVALGFDPSTLDIDPEAHVEGSWYEAMLATRDALAQFSTAPSAEEGK